MGALPYPLAGEDGCGWGWEAEGGTGGGTRGICSWYVKQILKFS